MEKGKYDVNSGKGVTQSDHTGNFGSGKMDQNEPNESLGQLLKNVLS